MKNLIRSQRGVSGIIIVLCTAFMILLPLGILGFEFMRYSLVQQELRSVADAASLTGAVGIATNGGGGKTLWQQEQEAMSAAYNAFCYNQVTDCPFVPLGQSGTNVNKTEPDSKNQPGHFNHTAPFTNVPAKTADVNFVLLDSSGNVTNWNIGAGPDQAGLRSASNLRVDAYFGYSPPLLGALGIGPFTMVASSTGGLPQLDVVLCFDVSGSMDDFTNITFVNRYWTYWTGDAATSSMSDTERTLLGKPSTWVGGCIEYVIPVSTATYAANPPYWNSGSVGTAAGPLYKVTGCDTRPDTYNGTSVNVQPPMNLNQEALCPKKLFFRASQRNSGQGKPPGNGPGQPLAGSAPQITDAVGLAYYTDLVVNLNGDAQWTVNNASSMGKTFETIAWGVEAARGNLEDGPTLEKTVNPEKALDPMKDNGFQYLLKVGNAPAIKKDFTSIQGAGMNGAQLAYWDYVVHNTHPLYDSVKAAGDFFTFLYGSADCHFGLICFSDGIGKAKDDTWADGWENLPGTTHLNGWTVKEAGGGSSTPPKSANIAGFYNGGTGMGPPDSLNPTGGEPNGVDDAGGSGIFPLPMLTLNDGQAYSIANSFDNYTEASTRMVIGNPTGMSVDSSKVCNTGGIVATGSTDIGDALQEAIRQLNPTTGLTRPNATRAIVLFTDGCPNIDYNVNPPSSSFDTCKDDCVAQASIAHGMNPPINIYSIGLALDPNLQAKQTDLLTNITNAANGGPSGPSTYKQITDSSEIEKAFQTIAKNLVVITK